MGVTRCPFPDKEKLTKGEAKRRAMQLSQNPGARPVYAYACPGGGHSHVGHRYGRKRRKW